MKDQSNGPLRSQYGCSRLKAITEPFNPIHLQERRFFISSFVKMNNELVRALISGMGSSLLFQVILQIVEYRL